MRALSGLAVAVDCKRLSRFGALDPQILPAHTPLWGFGQKVSTGRSVILLGSFPV